MKNTNSQKILLFRHDTSGAIAGKSMISNFYALIFFHFPSMFFYFRLDKIIFRQLSKLILIYMEINYYICDN